MRTIYILLLTLFFMQPAWAQVPDKQEMNRQMREAIAELNKQIIDLEKQIADAKINNEDSTTIRDLEKQVGILKKQVGSMEGLNRSLNRIPDKTFELAGEEGKDLIPKRDSARIRALPKKILTAAEVFSLINVIHADVEKTIPPEEKMEASKIYNNVKSKYESPGEISNAAAGCWIYGHWEKAVWLAGRACINDRNDANNLNNYASYLSMIGAEHAALPILQYLNNKYPRNSTILNNIGQAWFGLGEVKNAEKYLDSATRIFPNHSMANLSLSTIYRARGDSSRAVAALRRSIKNSYTPDKEAELAVLGVALDDDDIEFDYPMEEDAFGFEPFFDVFPSIPGSISETNNALGEWAAFYEAADSLVEKTDAEKLLAAKRAEEFKDKFADSAYNQPILRMHNGTVYTKAIRKLPLAINKKSALTIVDVMNMMANAFHEVTTERLNALEVKRRQDNAQAQDCAARDAANNEFMASAKAVIGEGRQAMKRIYLQNKKKVHNFLKLAAYASLNDYNNRMEKFHEEIWQKNQWLFTYTAGFAHAYRTMLKQPAMFSSCDDNREPPKLTKQLPELKTPECILSDSIKLCIGKIVERCNTCEIDESDLKSRQNETQKGEIILTIGHAVPSSSSGPQQESNTSKTNTISCRKSGYVKVDKGRARSGDIQCTSNSERPSSYQNGVRMVGGRLMR